MIVKSMVSKPPLIRASDESGRFPSMILKSMVFRPPSIELRIRVDGFPNMIVKSLFFEPPLIGARSYDGQVQGLYLVCLSRRWGF